MRATLIQYEKYAFACILLRKFLNYEDRFSYVRISFHSKANEIKDANNDNRQDCRSQLLTSSDSGFTNDAIKRVGSPAYFAGSNTEILVRQ